MNAEHGRTVSVQEAIGRGLRKIDRPEKLILFAGTLLPVACMCSVFSYWWLLFIPAGIFLSLLYRALATPDWRIWAYRNVQDIHQLQRSAELARLLASNSHEKVRGIMSNDKRKKLEELLTRFSEDAVFTDDPLIPEETKIYCTGLIPPEQPEVILNQTGINIEPDGFFEWGLIENERITQTTYSKWSTKNIDDISAGKFMFFRFTSGDHRIEIHMSTIAITEWKLDLLLYVYRNRFLLKIN